MSTKKTNKKTTEQRLGALEAGMNKIDERLTYITKAIEKMDTQPDEAYPDDRFPNTREGVIGDIIENFDFKKMSDVMGYLDWKWCGMDGPPSEDVLMAEAEKQLKKAFKYLDNKEYDHYGYRENHTGCGGFDIWVCESKDGKRWADLKFVVDNWRVEPEDCKEE